MRRFLAIGLLCLSHCTRPECTPSDFRDPECRVIAENELAQLKSSDGVEVRFQDPDSDKTATWDAKGLVRLAEDGTFKARVAGLGSFRISVHRPEDGPLTVGVAIDNVHPDVPTLDGEVDRIGLVRHLELELVEAVTEIRGDLPEAACSGAYRVGAVADIQTNPLQFSRIVEALHEEADDGPPLLGLVLLGDVAELGSREEMRFVAELMAASPVPIALTAGNHDVYSDVDAVFNETFGPGNHVFDVCDAHFTLLDTGSGYLAASVRGRLNQLFQTDRRFLIAGMHHPPYPKRTSSGWSKEDQAQHLVAELSAHDGDLILAGHLHQRLQFPNTPVPQIIVGTGGATQFAVDPDFGFLRMEFDGNKMETCFVSVPAPGSQGDQSRRRGPDNCP